MGVDDLFDEKEIDLESLIHEFARLDSELREGYSRKRQIVSDLAGLAWEQRGSQNTVHLSAHDGMTIKVEFKSDTSYDAEQMRVVADLLGNQFDDLFKTKIEFVPQKRNLTKFLNTVSTEEKIQTAKELIQEATTTKQMSPYITVEKGAKNAEKRNDWPLGGGVSEGAGAASGREKGF